MNVYRTQGKCRNITMASTARAFSICYLSYWNERTTCCIKLQTLNVIRSLYFWHFLHFFPLLPWFFDSCLDWNGQNCRQNKTQQLLENFSPEEGYALMMPLLNHLYPHPVSPSWKITRWGYRSRLEALFCPYSASLLNSERFSFLFSVFKKRSFQSHQHLQWILGILEHFG